MSTIKIPTPLRTFTKNLAEVEGEGATVRDVLKNLDKAYPGLGAKLMDENGALRRYINVYANEEDIRSLQGLQTPVQASDKLVIMPAIAGGNG